jgi:hypothetical protein
MRWVARGNSTGVVGNSLRVRCVMGFNLVEGEAQASDPEVRASPLRRQDTIGQAVPGSGGVGLCE